MEPARQTVELFDFLYKDPSRTASYYAQLFGGKLISTEATESTKSTKETGGKGGIPTIIEGSHKNSKEAISGVKETIDPHDSSILDVIDELNKQNYVSNDPAKAPHHSIVIAKGTICFIDPTFMSFATIAFENEIEKEKAKPNKQKDREHLKKLEMSRKLFEKISFSSMYFMRMEDGSIAAGQIASNGMIESIPTHYFKHGNQGISDVYVIGVKEILNDPIDLDEVSFVGGTLGMAKLLREVVMPSGSINISPIAIFRKIVKS